MAVGGAAETRGPRSRYGRRKQRAGVWLMAPAGVYLAAFLLVPMGMLVYTSLQSGGAFSGRFYFDWNFANYADVIVQYKTQFARSVAYSIAVTLACLLLAYPMMYWIAFYGPGRVAERIRPLEALCDRLAEQATPAERERAVWNYVVSSRYEWLFWDAAYRQEDWPV